MNYRIRHFNPQNIPYDVIHDFEDRHFPGRDLDIEGTHWFVAYEGGAPWDKPVGCAGLQMTSCPSMLRPCALALLVSASIDEAHRGHGLQSKLIRKRLDLTRTFYNAKIAYTYTTPDNPASINSLLKNKFKACHMPDSLIGTDLDVGDTLSVVYWRKIL